MSVNYTPEQKNYKNYGGFGTFRMFVLENFPFIADEFDSMTYYQMLCKVVKYLKDTIENNKTIQENQSSVVESYNQLQNYVNSYLDNLDVQNEINLKLDNMAINGQLKEMLNKLYNELNKSVNLKISEQESNIAAINKKVISLTNNTPSFANSISEMNDTDKIYVNKENGHWYYYNGTAWEDCGTYQSMEVEYNSIKEEHLSNELKTEFFDDKSKYYKNKVVDRIVDIENNIGIEHKYPSLEFSIGRWITSKKNIDKTQTQWICSKILELKKGDTIIFPSNKYIAQLVYGEKNEGFLITNISPNITTGIIEIETDGLYALDLFKVITGDMTEEDVIYANNNIFVSQINTTKIDNITNVLKLKETTKKLELLKGRWTINNSVIDTTQTLWISTEKVYAEENSIIKFDGVQTSSQLITFDDSTGNVISTGNTSTEGQHIIKKSGYYALILFTNPVRTITDEIIEEINGSVELYTLKSEELESIKKGTEIINTNSIESQVSRLKPVMNEDNQEIKKDYIEEFKYPTSPIWGHEFLEHWYEKVYEGDGDNARVVLDGDSITAGYNSEGKDDSFVDMRGYAIKKIMKAGNYPMHKLTVINNGHGGRNSSEWVGDAEYGLSNWIAQYPNGFLDTAMQNNPDLLIIAWGMNDADKTHSMFTGLNTEQRLELFKNHMIEGLERIRGSKSINGRPAYNKSIKDLSIIICMPIVGGSEQQGRGNKLWNQYLREIIRPLCRQYGCAFADMTMRTYSHNEMGDKIWSTVTTDGKYGGIHPNKYSSAHTMSMLQDLIYPVCMWNIEI